MKKVYSMLTRGDFHIHSTASDGNLTPTEIVMYARNRGIDTIAITDHNSTGGVNEAAAAGMRYGVAVIPAVELSTRHRGESIHILGYFTDGRFHSNVFQDALKLIRNHRFNEVRRILSSFAVSHGSGDNLTVYEGICLLKNFGASVVLAHPVRLNHDTLQELLAFPFDGLEAKYCKSSYQETNYFIDLALKYFAFYTGGSDFHSAGNKVSCHCQIGSPCLDQMEMQMFLRNSGALVI